MSSLNIYTMFIRNKCHLLRMNNEYEPNEHTSTNAFFFPKTERMLIL